MQSSFDIARIETDGTLRLVLTGELDIATAPLLHAALEEAESSDVPTIVLDLAAVGFIDSSGLRVLLQAADRSTDNGGRLSIDRPAPQAQRLFELSGAGPRLPLVD